MVTDGIGGSPYGPGTPAGPAASRRRIESELLTARNLGSRVARVAERLKSLRQTVQHGQQGEVQQYEE